MRARRRTTSARWWARTTGLLLGLVLIAAGAGAKELPPAPDQFVLDEVGWLSPDEERALSQRLLQYERESSNQIVVALLRSLEGEALGDYSQRLAEHWGIGQGERDNGILLAAYAEDRQMAIEVGYGLEPVVTDLIAARIREDTLVPAFRAGSYAEGIAAAVEQLIAASRGEFEGTGRAQGEGNRRREGDGFPFWLILLILFLVLGGGRGRRSMVGPVLLGSMLGGRGGRGGFGGGGFGGGGFSGGGGSFGGGGARGGW